MQKNEISAKKQVISGMFWSVIAGGLAVILTQLLSWYTVVTESGTSISLSPVLLAGKMTAVKDAYGAAGEAFPGAVWFMASVLYLLLIVNIAALAAAAFLAYQSLAKDESRAPLCLKLAYTGFGTAVLHSVAAIILAGIADSKSPEGFTVGFTAFPVAALCCALAAVVLTAVFNRRRMKAGKFFTTRMIVSCGLLMAISIVFTRLLMIEPTPNIRITFGNLPIVLCGLMFGPVAGGITGFLADFLGVTFFSPYPWFAPLGLSPMLIGAIPGLLRYVFIKRRSIPSLVACLVPAYILGPLTWSTYSLHLLYGSPLSVMLTTRIPVSATIAAVEIIVVCLFVKSGAPRAAGLNDLTLVRKSDRLIKKADGLKS